MSKDDTTESNVGTYKKSQRRKSDNVCVRELELLYLICDKGLLHENLRGVHRDRVNSEKFVWFFRKDPEILEVVEEYEENKKSR